MKQQLLAALCAASMAIVTAQADVLYADVAVSNSGTDNSIGYPNTSRNVAISPTGTIYVVYSNANGIYVARSTNRGQSFKTPVKVGSTQSEAEIGVDENGKVYVVWNALAAQQNDLKMALESKASEYPVKLTTSSDGGVTFTTPVEIGIAGGTCHIALDAPHVYVVVDAGGSVLHNHNSGQGTFTETTINARAYADIHVDYRTGNVYMQNDDPNVFVYKSSDHAATFGAGNPTGSQIYYSTTVLASTDDGVFLYTCGNGSAALRIDVSDYSTSNLTFNTTTDNRGRTLAVDPFSNVIDGYVDGTKVKYAISEDNGESFGTPVTIATASYLSLAINPRYGDIVAVYQAGGKIYATTYAGEITYPPAVTTTAITENTGLSALSGGDVVSDGGDTVTARGVCWNSSGSPTTADSKTSDGAGKGSYTSELTGLELGTTYYVRAYATNSTGTGYGEVVEFTTPSQAVPAVTTSNDMSIEAFTATLGGDVLHDGDSDITARGICWSTSENPTIADSKTTEAGTTGAFTSELTELTAETTYYARAYATNGIGTGYGEQVSFTTPFGGLPDLEVVIEVQNASASDPNASTDPNSASSGTEVGVGEDVFITITVRNKGTATATSVTVTLPIPEGLEFIAAYLKGVSQSGQNAPLNATVADGNVTLTLDNVDPNQALDIDMQFTARTAGAVTFQASAASEENPTPTTAQANTQVDVEDQYWEVRNTITPLTPCSFVGFASLLALVSLVTMTARRR